MSGLSEKPVATSEAFAALRSVRLPRALAPSRLPLAGDGLVAADLFLERGRIAGIAPPEVMKPGGIVWPCPVDCHTHIDKGQVWPRTKNPDGTFANALSAAAADRAAHPGDDDLRRRADFSLRAAHAHGTRTLRSHVDGGEGGFTRRWAVLRELAEDWRGRLDVQLAPFAGPEEPWTWIERLADFATESVAGVLSAFLYPLDTLPGFLDRIIRLAEARGLALDFHADETLDPTASSTRLVAEAVLRNRFEGPVLVGHACALSVKPEAERDRDLDLIASSGIGIVALPLCNQYLMGRGPATTPLQRGVAPVHELRARGVKVALASDNVRDPFHAYGDMDMTEVFREGARMLHLDHPVGDWPAVVLSHPADLIGRPERGRIAVGAPADLILFRARNWSEFMARPQHDRIVLRGGAHIDTTPPDFSELDDLEGMAP